MQLKYGSLSITTPVSHLANEFDVRRELHGQVSLAAVNQILCCSWGGSFWPSGIIWTTLVEVYYVMLHINIKTLALMVSDKKIFHVFPFKSLCKICDPGASHFGHRHIIRTNFVEVTRLCYIENWKLERSMGGRGVFALWKINYKTCGQDCFGLVLDNINGYFLGYYTEWVYF